MLVPYSTHSGAVRVSSADALGNVAFPEGACGLLWRIEVLDLSFSAFRSNIFLTVVSLCGSVWAPGPWSGQGFKPSSGAVVVLWCNKCSCMVLFIVLTMCCRNRAQSWLSICTFPLVSDKGSRAEFAWLSRGMADLRRDGSSFSQERWSFTVEQSLAVMVENGSLICS